MGPFELLTVGGMFVAWLGVLGAAVVPALVLDTRRSFRASKIERETLAYESARSRG